MLTVEENERLTRVGTGTPMGKFSGVSGGPVPVDRTAGTRRRAVCACASWAKTSSPSATPTARSASSTPTARTAARRCSSAATRKTACAASTTAGSSTSTAPASTCRPSRPDTTFKAKVKILAYPTVETGGVVWTYMGPQRTSARAARLRMDARAATHRYVSKTFENCNWLQAIEGGLDTAHSSFAHNNHLGNKPTAPASTAAPTIEVERTDYGYYYVSTRDMGDDGKLLPRLSLRDAGAADAREQHRLRRTATTDAAASMATSGCRSMTTRRCLQLGLRLRSRRRR